MRGEIVLAVGRARHVWPLLGDMTILDRLPRAAPPQDTLRRRRMLAELHELDRAGRFEILRDRAKPTGPMPTPGPVDALDVRALIDQVAVAYAPQVYQAATGLRLAVAQLMTAEQRTRAALSTVVTYAPQLADNAGALPMLIDLVDELNAATAAGEKLAQVEPDATALPLPCPACRTRSLRIRHESPWPSEWVVECRFRSCVCPPEIGCPCGMTVRVPGRRHVWLRTEWERLTVVDRLVGETTPA